MKEVLLGIDHSLFFWINHWPHTPLSDAVALTLSGVFASTVIIWLLLAVWLFVREEKRDHWFFLPVAVASGLSLFITDLLLKNFFARIRPSGALLTDYSFPSGHATFAWALAVVLASKEPRARWLFYSLAFFISLSRVYLGVHYPADIVAGSMIGVLIGLVVQYAYAQVKRQGIADDAGERGSRKRPQKKSRHHYS
jgi:undecaprenyl-diphosphatase